MKIWVNGVQESSFSTANYPAQDTTLNFGNTGDTLRIGERDSGEYWNGCMSHLHFIDGATYDASTFGETDTDGEWKIKTSPTISSYGNNGFFMKFEDSTNMDLDSSPNGHTFSTSGNLTPTLECTSNVSVSYTHIRDNETREEIVCSIQL